MDAVASSSFRSNKDLLGFMFAESQIIATHLDFDRVPQRREADQFDGRPDQQAHFHQARAAFRRKLYFGNDRSRAQRD